MWNLAKLGKSLYHLATTYGTNARSIDNPDLIGDERLDHVLVLYRELNFPFGLISVHKQRLTKGGRDVLWGRKFNEKDYVENEVLPKLMDFEYLSTLAPNTVGAHYYHLVKDFGIDCLYDQRFKEEENREDHKLYHSFSDDIRTNVSRHNLLSHDIWHVLYRYDTSVIGEGMIQTISAYQANFWPMHIVGFGVTLKESIRHRSLMPWKVWKEARKLGRETSAELYWRSPVWFLERDIEEVRNEFNIKPAEVFAEYVRTYPEDFHMDTIHPQYQDTLFTL
ncbi:MAG: hypothetical protein DWQ49_03965 [Bacteroidetes bacterium]|nr:MAG: hypothetical protein DWQ49_03965 [Bacteroidota bacterium]